MLVASADGIDLHTLHQRTKPTPSGTSSMVLRYVFHSSIHALVELMAAPQSFASSSESVSSMLGRRDFLVEGLLQMRTDLEIGLLCSILPWETFEKLTDGKSEIECMGY